MNIDLSLLSEAFQVMLGSGYKFFLYGGWILLLFLVFRIVYTFYMNSIQEKFKASNPQVFLHIRVDKENLVSTRAVDAMFSQLHASHASLTWAEKYLEGKIQLWFSFEIVSIGGKISYIVRTPERYVHLVETSFYAAYPNAEITRVEDYMAHLGHWTPHSSWDLWGTEYLHLKDYAYPLRTYRDFEHPAAEEKIIDPLATMLEAMGKIEPHELFAVQYVIRPIGDKEWIPHVREVVQELKGEAEHHKSFMDVILSPLNILGKKHFFQIVSEAVTSGAHHDEPTQPKVMRMTEGEKNVIAAIEAKGSKVGYETKIRTLYIAPKDRFDGNKKTAIIGAFRSLGGISTNDLKPDVSHSWTTYNYKVFKKLEQPYVDFMIAEKKHHMLEGFVGRSMWLGAQPMILNSEELATMYHFPLATVSVPPVETIDVKKGAPPANLPVFTE